MRSRRGFSTVICYLASTCAPTLFLALVALFASTSARSDDSFQKASISFRVGYSIWSNDERFAQLLELFEKYPDATDEITFFTQTTHSPIPDEELERRCLVLKQRIAATKAKGLRAGINVLCTLGHHPEDLQRAIGPEYPRAVTLEGNIAQGTLCPNNDVFKQRLRRVYAAVAQANPDYIWIDDDVRVGHMLDSNGTTGNICYCDVCFERLAKLFDEPITRDELKARLGEVATLVKLREFASDSINDVFAIIENVVHNINPDMPLGFMTGERYDEGYDFARWARTLAGPREVEVYWRPGGGFYEQSSMQSLFTKSHEIGRQISQLPPQIRVVQSEIENFPYQLLSKSANVTTLEAASHIATGCTGAAFNVLTMNDEPLDEYENLIATIAKRRAFYDLAVQKLGRARNVGVLPLWERTDGVYLNRTPIYGVTLCVAETGIPVAYDYAQDADVYLLSRNYLSHKTPEEAKKLFEKGVYADIDAINLANDPKTYALNDLTGMEYGGEIHVDGIEKYTEHPLNGKFSGRTRDCRQSFWRVPAYILKATRPNVEALSSCVDYAGEEKASNIMGIYENALGGRVCVNGYYAYGNFYSYPKQAQIRAVMRWLSKDRLPGYVESFALVYFWLREPNERGEIAGMLINANYDAAQNLAIRLKTDKNELSVYDFDCRKRVVRATDTDEGGYKLFVVPELRAWEPLVIATE